MSKVNENKNNNHLLSYRVFTLYWVFYRVLYMFYLTLFSNHSVKIQWSPWQWIIFAQLIYLVWRKTRIAGLFCWTPESIFLPWVFTVLKHEQISCSHQIHASNKPETLASALTGRLMHSRLTENCPLVKSKVNLDFPKWAIWSWYLRHFPFISKSHS